MLDNLIHRIIRRAETLERQLVSFLIVNRALNVDGAAIGALRLNAVCLRRQIGIQNVLRLELVALFPIGNVR